VYILSQEKESYYLYRGLRDVVSEGTRFAGISVGGGSTEIVIGNTEKLTEKLEEDIRMPFGINHLRNTFSDEQGVLQWDNIDAYLESEINVGSQDVDCFFLGGVFDFYNIVGPQIGLETVECSLKDHPFQIDIKTFEEQAIALRSISIESLRKLYAHDPPYVDNFVLGQSVYCMVVKSSV